MVETIITYSEEETLKWAKKLGSLSQAGSAYALYGELGTGKTIIAKGIALGLNIDEDITSPTFLLLEIYEGKLPFYHFDLYRVNSDIEFEELFFEEYWEGDGVSVIEWAEKAGTRIPANSIKITIEMMGDFKRRITVEYPDN